MTTPPLNPAEDFETPAKQGTLVGMEDAAIEEIETAAATYRQLTDKRIAALTKELAARAVLLEAMKKHAKTAYHRALGDGRVLHVTTTQTKEKAKVKYEDGEESS